MTVWRDLEDESGEVFLYVQKVRFRHLGKPGKVALRWNPVNGQYADVDVAGVMQPHDYQAGR